MRPALRFRAAALILLLAASSSPAQSTDPLRFIPPTAEAVVRVEKPRRLIEALILNDAYQRLYKLDAAKAYLDTLPVRNFYELVAYLEREFGAPALDLVDKLAGNGIALGVKFSDGKPLAMVVFQGTDEALTKRFVEKAMVVLEQELTLQEGGVRLERSTYKNIEALKIGDLHLARVGSALLAANSGKVLKAAIDAAEGGKSMADLDGPKQARKLLPGDPLLWSWLSLAPAKKGDQAKRLFDQPRNDLILTFAFAGILDVGRRSDFIALALNKTDDGFLATIRAPAGREGRGADTVLHLPDDSSVPGTLPLLEPKNVVYSHSFYQDLGALWSKRSQIMNSDQAKSFEEGEKQASRFLPGASLGKLFQQSGPHWRVVITNQGKEKPYKIQPGTPSGDFAVIASMRDPAFGKSVETMIRGAAIFAGFQVGGLKMFEEEMDGVKVFGYRFNEDGKFAADVDNLRFNFVPTFAAVNDQYIFASSRELCRELIGLIRAQAGAKPQTQNMRVRVYAKGAADSLTLTPDQLITAAILGQGLGEADARKQAEALAKYVESLGTVTVETDYSDKMFRLDLNWQMKKK